MTTDTKLLERQAIEDINALSLEVGVGSGLVAGGISTGRDLLDGKPVGQSVKDGALVGGMTGLCVFLLMKIIGELSSPFVPAWRKTLWVLGIVGLVIWGSVLNIQSEIEHSDPEHPNMRHAENCDYREHVYIHHHGNGPATYSMTNSDGMEWDITRDQVIKLGYEP
jgi:hypothetical protein